MAVALCMGADSRTGRLVAGLVAACALAIGISLIVALVAFRPATCRVLGGHMTLRGHCTAEFGGSGDNG